MADEQKVEELKGKITKQTKVDTEKVIKQIATRDKLERDYKEDILNIEFSSSPETIRLIKARRPTPKQMTAILELNAKAILLGSRTDEKSTKATISIYKDLSEIAAELTIDKKLDEDFWFGSVSTTTLQNVIGEIMRVTQAGPIKDEQLSNFRVE